MGQIESLIGRGFSSPSNALDRDGQVQVGQNGGTLAHTINKEWKPPQASQGVPTHPKKRLLQRCRFEGESQRATQVHSNLPAYILS